MKPVINISEELKQISEVVADIGFQVPYKVPDGYFDRLPEDIINRIYANEDSEVLPKNIANPVYGVPAGYFENLSENILQKIRSAETTGAQLLTEKEQETPGFSLELNDLKHETTYTVPAGYFEELNREILHKIGKSAPAKIIRMNRSSKLRLYASAAVIAGMVLLGVLYYFNSDFTDSQPAFAVIKEVPVEELETYLSNYPVVFSENTTTYASSDLSSDDFIEILSDVPEEVLQGYLINYTDIDPETAN